MKKIIKILLRVLFRVEVKGLSNFAGAGDRVLVISNHISLLDAVIIKLFLSDDLAYAIDESAANRWWAKPFVNLLDFCVIDTKNPLSLKKLIDFLLLDRKILIFPEGRISNTNSLMKIYQSTGMVIDKSDASIVPVHIEGAQYSYFAPSDGGVRRRLFPKIIVTVLPGRKLNLPKKLKGQQRRDAAVEYLTAQMREAKFYAGDYNATLFRSLITSKKIHGGRYKIIEDINKKPLSYNQIIFRALLLGRHIEKETHETQAVGVFLPTTIVATVLVYALSLRNRIPAMLNYGAGKKALLNCIGNAKIEQVYTSRKFIQEGGFEDLLKDVSEHTEIRYVEDIVTKLRLTDKITAYLLSLFPGLYYQQFERTVSPDDTAAILFTSGSEGLPKGVALSHKNLLVNSWQVACVVDFSHKDVMLNFLPVFHSFGFTVGTILPLVLGIRLVQYPSPLHYKVIPELAYETDTSIIFSTNTFLSGYGQQAHPYDFHALRYVFSGAEPLSRQTEELWMEKFGVRILQGYGVTETSPALAANTALTYRRGSVGHFVPGIEYRLIDVPGIDNGRRLQIKGMNVMKGYILPDRPGEITPPETEESGKGWYDTGDIVDVDEDGYVFIRGRAKRFAKIGGEMISLAAVEVMVNNAWPENRHAVITQPDSSKGEQLVLFTDCGHVTRKELMSESRVQGLSDLHIPKKIITINELPVLPSGKINYPHLEEELQKSQ